MTYFPAPQSAGSLRGPHQKNLSEKASDNAAVQVEVMTLNEAAERIAFQVCELAEQDYVSQAAERLIHELVLAAIQLRGTAKGANQLSHFYATVLVGLAEQLNESEYLRDEWFIRWRDDCDSK